MLPAKASALPLSHMPTWLLHVTTVLKITNQDHLQRYWHEVVNRDTWCPLIFVFASNVSVLLSQEYSANCGHFCHFSFSRWHILGIKTKLLKNSSK